MPASQTTYTETHDEGRPGQVAKIGTYDGDTGIVDEDGGIGFGLACHLNNSGRVEVGLLADRFFGVSVLDPRRDPVDDDEYVKGAHGTFAYRGDIYVQVPSAVSRGAVATADGVTGAISAERVRGAWAAAQNYAVGDHVSHGGSHYRCVRAHDSVNAANNADGQPGAAGTTAWAVDAEQFVLPDARFVSDADANGLAVVRLSGIQYKTGAS